MSASIELLNEKRKARSERARRRWENPVYANKQRLAMLRGRTEKQLRMLRRKDKKHIQMLRSEKPPGWSRRMPTHGELLLNWLTGDAVQFVGDGIFWVQFSGRRRKNPDFVILGQDRVIEFLGDYWHRKFKQTDVERLIEMYWRAGIECLVIWESDFMKDRDQVLGLVRLFIGELN